MIYVPGIGPSNAKLMIVGEAPGANEEEQGIPFVGASGKMVDEFLKSAGSSRDEVYLTNVVKYRPPGNDIRKINQLGISIAESQEVLWNEVEALQPNCILAFGNTALTALTGEHGIEKWRGSILSSNRGYPKVVSTLHPASLMHKQADGKMRSWSDRVFIQWDVNRAVAQSKFKELTRPHRDIIIPKRALDVERYFRQYEGHKYAAVDIETFRTFPICIGISFSRSSAISIPLFQRDSGLTRTDIILIWELVSKFLINPNILKIGQNFKYDQAQLSNCCNRTVNFGMPVNGLFFDTHLAFKTLYCELPANLGFITSVLTEEPFYKDEGKEYNPKKDKLEVLLKYNGKDAYVTYEAFEVMLEELRERNLERYFFEEVMPLHSFYMMMEGVGLLRDKEEQKRLSKKYREIEGILQSELNTISSTYGIEEVNVMSNGINGQVGRFIYRALALPLRQGTDEKTLDALMRNACKDPLKKRALELVLEIRKVRKTRGTYVESQTHPDGRTRTSIKIMLETGRTSTKICKPPITTEKMGLAFQTITKHGDVGSDIRSMFVPDPGYVFIEADQSGAEARVVALLARDVKMLKMFEYDLDIHRITYSWVVGNAPQSLLDEFFDCDSHLKLGCLAHEINLNLKKIITSEDRQLGKKFRHAANYDMGKQTGAINAGISELRANKILNRVHDTNPGIRGVFHKEIQEAMRDNNRTLVNPFGRTRQFFNKWGHDLFKEAYAQIPQSTISDHTKHIAQSIEKKLPEVWMVIESHDSFTMLCPKNLADKAIELIREEVKAPIDFSQCTLPRGPLDIPWEIQVGEKNWLEMKKI